MMPNPPQGHPPPHPAGHPPRESHSEVSTEHYEAEEYTVTEIMSYVWVICLPLLLWWVRFSISRKYKADDEAKKGMNTKINELYEKIQHLETELEKHPDRHEMDGKIKDAKDDLKELIKAGR